VVFFNLLAIFSVTLLALVAELIAYVLKGKGNAITLEAWTDPEGSRRLRLPDFKKIGT
jgi:hypothetical protein